MKGKKEKKRSKKWVTIKKNKGGKERKTGKGRREKEEQHLN